MQQFILITPDQLQTLIETAVRKIFLEQNHNPKQEENQLLNVVEAAKFLGMARQTLYSYTSRRLIPFFKRGGKKILFRRSELIAYLEEGRKASISEIKNNLKNS